MNAFDALTLEATLRALAEQPDELPDALQQSLGAIGHEFATHQPQAVDQLRTLVSESSLSLAYDAAYRDLQTRPSQVERNKSLLLRMNGSRGIDLDILAAGILTAPQPTQSARQFLRLLQQKSQTIRIDYLDSFRPLQQPSQPSRSLASLWERLDRIMVMAAGGAFLGGVVAQIPGALVGTILATLYGGYISMATPQANRNG